MKRITKSERAFARRILARAVAIAERNNAPLTNQQELWRLMVEASRKAKK